MSPFSVVDNRYMGEGIAFIIVNQPKEDRWKNTQHGDFYSFDEANDLANELNSEWGVL